jgi:hypothetical protein
VRELREREREPSGLDVIGGGVGAGVPGRSTMASGSPPVLSQQASSR